MKHTINFTFTTDSQLTDDQMDNLISILALQVEEPQDLEGNEEKWQGRNIDFSTTDRRFGRFIVRN